MTPEDPSRLDRIEKILEAIAGEVRSVKDIAMSNARAIEASHQEFIELRQEWQRDRSRLYQVMADVANAQASFYHAQASFTNRLESMDIRQDELSRRQGEIVEILKLLSQQDK